MSRNIFKINKGDSFEFLANIPEKADPTKNYILTANDALYFALMYPHQDFKDAILIKGYTYNDHEVDLSTGTVNIQLSHRETEQLVPGVYYYTVKLYRGGSFKDLGASIEPDEVRTIIERTKFIVNN